MYEGKCELEACQESYIGETLLSFNVRKHEHEITACMPSVCKFRAFFCLENTLEILISFSTPATPVSTFHLTLYPKGGGI